MQILRGWPPLFILPAAVVFLTPHEWPRWAFMWTLATAIFFGCKWLTWRRRPKRHAPLWRHAGYLLAWPGLDAAAFCNPGLRAVKPDSAEWIFAIAKLASGSIIFVAAASKLPSNRPYLLGWIGMIGLVMSLHFGLFHLLSCTWRSLGVEARPLMNWPGTAVRLADFWGRRWNTAFRDLTHRFLFKPLSRRLGGGGALWAGFLVSGMVHDLVISFPAGGGYGGPTIYFLLQATGLSVERSRVARRFGAGKGIRGWAFAMAFLILPAPLLFHRPFVIGVIVPFMRAVHTHAFGAF